MREKKRDERAYIYKRGTLELRVRLAMPGMSDSAAAAAIQRRVRSRQLPAEDASPPASAAKKVSSGRKLGEPVPVKFKAPPSTSPKAGSRKLGEPVKVKSPSKLSSKSTSEAPTRASSDARKPAHDRLNI